ncbi:cytochrome P450 [Mycena crocata]|nr:cytochrome P450 [Mycena crocata]
MLTFTPVHLASALTALVFARYFLLRKRDIASLTVLGQSMIIVNSLKIVEDLLDVKGGNFSDRPVIQMGGELVGLRNVLTLSQYGGRVREERKLFHQLFGTQKTTGAIVLRIAYGYQITENEDPFLEMFDIRAGIFARSTQQAAFLVNIVPALRYLPEWFPGGGFRTTAKKWTRLVQNSVNAPHDYVKQQMVFSFTSTLLQERSEEDHLIKWAASAIQAGGRSTTSSQLEAFFLAMSLYPEVQAEAQRELDSVVGNDRLPEISDRSVLPYMNALKITHDPDLYTNPMVFDPSRFIGSDTRKAELDPSRICFGYGRR